MTKKNRDHHYLMLKTHNKTGLKYLCYTTKEDPFKYPGSGKRWKNHLQKHGGDIHTEILGDYETKDELIRMGRVYSEEWNVVEDDGFANLRIEEGDGGDTSSFIDYASMKPMPRGKWKRSDLSEYNKTRENPRLKILTCPHCGETGYGYDWIVEHLSASYWKRDVPIERYNCPKNPHRILNYNEEIYEVDGEELTINDVAQRYNLTKQTIYQRLAKGEAMQEVVSRPQFQPKTYSLFGEELTTSEIVKAQKIPSTTLRRILKKTNDLDTYFRRRDSFHNGSTLHCDKCNRLITHEKMIIKHFELCSYAS